MSKIFNWEEGDKEVDEKLRKWFAKKKIQKLKHSSDGKEEESIDEEAVERAIRLSVQQSQHPSLLTMENINSREEPNPKLDWKMKHWFSHN